MTLITGTITDLAGAPDSTAWEFYTPLRESDNGVSVITTQRVRRNPVAGALSVTLDPGFAVVSYKGLVYNVTVPASGPVDIYDLLAAAVAFPPGTSAQDVAAAVNAYMATSSAVFWESLGPVPLANLQLHTATAKTPPVDADEIPLLDSAASFGVKKVTWANVKAAIKAYYDSVTSTLTNKSISGSSNTLTNISADSLIDGTTNHVFTAADDTKLTGIATSATANATDAQLRDRTTHTGTQTSSTIADFTEAAQDAVAALLAGTSGVSLSYDDAANTLTITGPGSSSALAEDIRDAIGIALLGSGLISVAVNDTDANLKNRANHTGSQTASTISDFVAAVAAGVHAATSKTTPVDADELLLVDSAASFGLKRLTWANLKAAVVAAVNSIFGRKKFYVDSYGADPTGVANSDAAVAAARTAMGTEPGVLVFGIGTYELSTAVARFYEKQGVLGDGRNATLINYSGTGVLFTAYDTRAAGAGGPGTGAIYGRMTVDGSAAPASSGGFQLGDLSGIRVEDLQVNNFDATTSFGVKFLNQTTWTERINATITTYNCTQGVVFDGTGGNSFGYPKLWLNIVALANQDGLVLSNSAYIYNAGLEMVGNFTGAAGSNTGTAVLIGTGGAGDPATINQSQIRITLESNGTSGWIAHKSLAIGSNGSCQLQGQGLLRFASAAGVTWVAPTGTSNKIAFAGVISIPGYNSWSFQQGLAVRGYAGYSTSFMGASGGSIFLSTGGNYLATTLTSGAHTYNVDSGSTAKASTGEASSWDLFFIQPASGGVSTITWPAEFTWIDGAAPVLSTAVSGVDHIHLVTYDFVTFYAKHVNGNVSAASVDAAATASKIPQRTAEANILADAFIPGSTSTATAAGTTTLTVDSTEVQILTGATTQTVVLPTTGIAAGHRLQINNLSSGAVTVQSSGLNTIVTIPGGPNSAILVANTATPTTAAHWTSMAFPSATQFTSSFAVTNTIPVRNAQGNVLADVFISSLATVVTAAGTTTLTVDSVGTTVFTGSTTQTVTLATTSLVAGHTYRFINTSSGAITINSSGGNLVKSLAASSTTTVTALVATPTTAAHWFAS